MSSRKRSKSRDAGSPKCPGLVPIAAIPGYQETDLEPMLADLHLEDPAVTLIETRERILKFLRSRDAIAVLAKSCEQFLIENTAGRVGPGPSGLEQVDVELLQVFLLVAGPGKPVPASPHSMLRLWRLLKRNLAAYVVSLRSNTENAAEADVITRVRLRTVAYRNAFNSRDAAEIVPALLAPLDASSQKELGYRLSDFARALFDLLLVSGERLNVRRVRCQTLFNEANNEDAVQEIVGASKLTSRMGRCLNTKTVSADGRGQAAFQIAEMLCPSLFAFGKNDLAERFGEAITAALFSCALPFGALSDSDLSTAFLNNPIWKKPFILISEDVLLFPMPSIAVSFPFAIIERLIEGKKLLREAYSNARADFLENDVERIVRNSLPSAIVYRSVKWSDPDTGRPAENDVVAVIGMHVLIFEAKAGKLTDAARRGGMKSLRTNFRELFIEPGDQAARLEALLARPTKDFKLVDRNGRSVAIDPKGPSIVHKFGVCIEQFPGVTGSRKLFKDLNLLKNDQNWAPILTLGELRMISRHLDTELSFLHYLTRRTTIDDMFDAIADEQDLLSMYLINGFSIDPKPLENRKVMFFQADAAVRGAIEPRSNRREYGTAGVQLPPLWRLIGKEIYEGKDRHCFDILVTILNQDPKMLMELEKRIRRWRLGGGKGGGDMISGRFAIGSRVFVVVVHMAKHLPPDAESWATQSREINRSQMILHGATDCVVLLMTRKSKDSTFDAMGFFRNKSGSETTN